MGTRSPSLAGMTNAQRLGRMMAQRERQIRPMMGNARDCISYLHFIDGHRTLLERMPAFDRWAAELRTISEDEARSQGMNLDKAKDFEEFLQYIAGPMRSAFWYAWETSVNLMQHYARCATTHHEGPAVLKIANRSAGDSPENVPANPIDNPSGGSGFYDLTTPISDDLGVRPEDVLGL